MVSDKFRHQLRQESQQWQREGWLSSEQYQQLSQRYEFDQLDSAASDRFITILIGVGFVLLGLGLITFVAANWQALSREFRVVLLVTLFLGVNISGFYLWQQPTTQPKKQRLGYGLLLLGSLSLGANMALMSQLFHQSGPIYELFLYWSLGILPMAWALRLTSLGVLSEILLGMAYGSAPINWSKIEEFGLSILLIEHLPIALSLLFLPLAYWCRSRVIFALASIGITLSFSIRIIPVAFWDGGGIFAAIAFILPVILWWGYHDPVLSFLRGVRGNLIPPFSRGVRGDQINQPFAAIARSLSIFFFSIILYFFSFHGFWEEYQASSYLYATEVQKLIEFSPDILWLTFIALLGWVQICRHPQNLNPLQKLTINHGFILIVSLLTSLLFIWHLNHSYIMTVATITVNFLFALLSIGLIRDGLTLVQRQTFWAGMVMLVLQIISRMFEYDTGLILKAVVFVICGIAIIGSGLWFERELKPASSEKYD